MYAVYATQGGLKVGATVTATASMELVGESVRGIIRREGKVGIEGGGV